MGDKTVETSKITCYFPCSQGIGRHREGNRDKIRGSQFVIAGLVPAIVRSRARSVQGGASPLQVILLRPVADRNCVAARRGGEQRKATEPSVAKANSIRPR